MSDPTQTTLTASPYLDIAGRHSSQIVTTQATTTNAATFAELYRMVSKQSTKRGYSDLEAFSKQPGLQIRSAKRTASIGQGVGLSHLVPGAGSAVLPSDYLRCTT
jgi:hypothetical protein